MPTVHPELDFPAAKPAEVPMEDTLLLDKLPLPGVDFCLGMGAGGCTQTTRLGGSQHTISKFSPLLPNIPTLNGSKEGAGHKPKDTALPREGS